MASKTSNLDLRTSKLASPTDEDTAIFEGAAVIAAGILNIAILLNDLTRSAPLRGQRIQSLRAFRRTIPEDGCVGGLVVFLLFGIVLHHVKGLLV